jgi:hypothetical protein
MVWTDDMEGAEKTRVAVCPVLLGKGLYQVLLDCYASIQLKMPNFL